MAVNNSARRMALIAITTKSSTSVNAARRDIALPLRDVRGAGTVPLIWSLLLYQVVCHQQLNCVSAAQNAIYLVGVSATACTACSELRTMFDSPHCILVNG